MTDPLTCSGCGHPMARAAGSLPQGAATCQPCRRSRRPSATCPQCAETFRAVDDRPGRPRVFCSRRCGARARAAIRSRLN